MRVLWFTFFGFLIGGVHLQILRKYYQSDYEIKLDHVEIIGYNRKYLKDLNVAFAWYNRSQRVINGSCTVLFNPTTDILIEIQFYKFLSNEYRYFPITLRGHACEAILGNYFGLRDCLKKYSNLSCPMRKGFYYAHNAVLDYTAFPPNLPSGQYKVSANFTYRKEYLSSTDIYAAINTFITKWES